MSFPRPEGSVWVDGSLVEPDEACLRLADPDVQAGIGVFETIAVRDARPVGLRDHLERLATTAAALDVSPGSVPALDRAARAVASRVPGGFGWLKIVAMRSGRRVVFGGRMDPDEEGRPASAVLLPWRRNPADPIAGMKTLNYAPSILGLEEARRRGADEGIWLNTRGHLAEGCTSNLFVVWRRKVFTPSLRDGIFPGITRARVIASIREQGLVLHEGKVRLHRLEQADEAFLTSSLRAVRPLVRFEGKPVGKREEPGPVTRAIAAELARRRRPREAEPKP